MGKRHGDHVLCRAFINPSQQGAGQNAVIWPFAPDKIGQDHAIHQTMRMIGHQHHGPCCGNTVKLCLWGQQINAHDLHRSRPKLLPFRGTKFFKCTHAADDRDLARHPFYRPNNRACDGAFECVGVGQAAPIIDGALRRFGRHNRRCARFCFCRLSHAICPLQPPVANGP